MGRGAVSFFFMSGEQRAPDSKHTAVNRGNNRPREESSLYKRHAPWGTHTHTHTHARACR